MPSRLSRFQQIVLLAEYFRQPISEVESRPMWQVRELIELRDMRIKEQEAADRRQEIGSKFGANARVRPI